MTGLLSGNYKFHKEGITGIPSTHIQRIRHLFTVHFVDLTNKKLKDYTLYAEKITNRG